MKSFAIVDARVPGAPASPPDAGLLESLDGTGPRYTSYPTADRFVEAYTADDYRRALTQRRSGGVTGSHAPLALYVHLPFCGSMGYGGTSTSIVTRDHEVTQGYLDALEREMALVATAMGDPPAVSQVHLGGGTPTFLSDSELGQLMDALRRHFRLLPHVECAIDIDPRTIDRERLSNLADLGFHRLSLSVQEVDPRVQPSAHGGPSLEAVAALMRDARELGFASLNVDLVYGLPRQTREGFAATVAQIGEWMPDRIALHGYAQLPERFRPQRRFDSADLPDATERASLLAQAIEGFLALGYQYIGMDHFALPQDPLAQARRQGRLHRNFQGYSTQPDGDLIGLGVSAIGRIGAAYSQNAKTLAEYGDALMRGELPVARGINLSRDDLVRRAVIMAVMCHGRVSYESIELAHLINFRRYFAAELEPLVDLAARGLLRLHADGFELTSTGWFFVRQVAMVFDRHLQADQARLRYSRVI